MDVIEDGKNTLQRMKETLNNMQKSSRKLLNQPLVVGIICVVLTVSLTLIGSCILEKHFNNENMYRPSKAEIQIIDYDIVKLNPEQKLYDVGVRLRVENPKFSQRSITVDQTSISINIPSELRHELINISDYYNYDRDWMESFSYSHGTPLTINPGDIGIIESDTIYHSFRLLVPGEYQVRVSVDYYDSLHDYTAKGYFNISVRDSGSIIIKENRDVPIKFS